MNPRTRIGVLGAVVVLAAWSGLGSRGPASPATPATSLAAAAATSSVAYPHQPSRLAPEPPVVDPGTLPQTRVLPGTDDPAFQDRVRALWQGIVDDRPEEAYAFFFPKTAYVQLKALANAAADYDHRLLGYYDLDVHAAHRLLGPDPASAQLVGVDVPAAAAEWMWPGSEENRLSYYRVYGSRLTYTLAGRRHSFGIFSLLSWRGQWYAVHFGPWPRGDRYGNVYAAR
jgi:hypothetical protein